MAGKICVLLIAWFLMGMGIYWGTCIVYCVKLAMLNYNNYDELACEFLNMITYNRLGVKSTKDNDSIRKAVENMTGEPVQKSLVRMYLVWPKTMGTIQPVMQEAYLFLKDKYGLRSQKSAT